MRNLTLTLSNCHGRIKTSCHGVADKKFKAGFVVVVGGGPMKAIVNPRPIPFKWTKMAEVSITEFPSKINPRKFLAQPGLNA